MISKSGYKVVITGITGSQGGSVYQALKASSKPYSITGITRDTSKPAAKQLEADGVNVIKLVLSADNTEEVAEAWTGLDGVFAMTNFLEHGDSTREIAEGKMMVDAAKKAGVKRFIYAGLPNYKDVSGGKFTNVDHYDGKAEVDAYAKEQGLNSVSVQPSMYMQSLLPSGMMAPRKGEDGSYNYFFPQGFAKAKLSIVDIERDYGLFVQQAFENEEAFPAGSVIRAVSAEITGQEVLDIASKISGKKIGAIEAPPEVFEKAIAAATNEKLAIELSEMLQAIFEFGYYGGAEIESSRKHLSKKPNTWQEFAEAGDWSKL